MSNFNTLTVAVVNTNSGTFPDVVLSWTMPRDIRDIVSAAVQKSPFGSVLWSTLTTLTNLATLTYTDFLGVHNGQFSYRLVMTDSGGTEFLSNLVNIGGDGGKTGTGGIVLTLVSAVTVTSPPGKRVTLSWVIGDGVIDDDAVSVEIQRTIDGVNWRHAALINTFENTTYEEELPLGLGAVFYRAVMNRPTTIAPYNLPSPTLSGTVTIST